MSAPGLTQFKVLLFDVYATLVDWETGIFEAMKPMLVRVGSPLAESKRDTLLAFESVEVDLQAKYPTMLYSDILAHTHAELKRRLSNKPSIAPQGTAAAPVEASQADGTSSTTLAATGTSASADAPATPGLEADDIAFGKSIPQWPVFPDTIAALARLSQHYKLAVLSNVDHPSFAATRAILERSDPAHAFAFDAVFTAQDIGSYKPDPANFEYALKRLGEMFGAKKEDVLITAASLHHDHAPANKLGIKGAYIARQGAVMSQSSPAKYDWKFNTLGEMADEVERQAQA
ncbi:HAD-like protein [Phanerochaete sordida]|uniref:HAD-like protein n=1 Tax=Phanerochaete sordida TaxID=48140 RepID=A0A9P3LAG1_9APHY|nr:HAD-like protein [Phanerochaete sordida]